MLTRIVKLTFKPGYADDFVKVFNETRGRIAAFEGCKGVELLREIDQPGVFFTYSHWANTHSLDNYRNSELFKTTWAIVKKHFAARPEAWSLHNEK